ncbi:MULTISPECIES: hypothetical protein [Pseudomonas]|uniref:DUF7693 family protein n=1 Tax=Pseudomonas TaxID=286 RepID=UPI002110468A|nr:hypothetical protein [Pseudomonas sp. PDM25]
MDTRLLTAQEVHQVLRDVTVGSRSMRRITEITWNEIYCGLMTVEVDRWVITFFEDCGELDYCDSCYSPDGRKYDFSSRDAIDPVELLLPDEHRQLEELLRRI